MDIPIEIKNLVNLDTLIEVHIGESKSQVYSVLGQDGQKYYLKISSSAYVANEIKNECLVFDWISNYGIVTPKKVKLIQIEKLTFFLMSAVPGTSLAECKLTPQECMRLGAVFLNKFHSLNIDKCPFDRSLKVTKKLALENIQLGLVDESDFDFENQSKSALTLFNELSQDFKEDSVFTHGDYCFPNILVQNSEVSGVIDLGRAGIADRYQDIALFLRSFKANIADPDISLFLKCYDQIKNLDNDKMAFYKKLDEFF